MIDVAKVAARKAVNPEEVKTSSSAHQVSPQIHSD
jgi:hypothetical protein